MKRFSGTSKNVSEIILVDDDDEDKEEEEDVEVVFTNLNKSHVYRNLMCQKIAQEIELLQAMCKAPFPSEFSEFKEHAKRLGFSDDVVQSAHQRIMKKYVSKLVSFPSNTAPVCRVSPISVPVSPIPAKQPVDSSQPLTASTPIASTAVPVALLFNKSVRNGNSPETSKEYSTTHINLIGTIEIDTDDESCLSTHSNSSAITRLVSPLEIGCSQSVAESPSKNKVSMDKNNSRKRRRETDVCNFDLNEEGYNVNNVSEELDEIQINFVNALTKSAVSDQNQLSEKKKVSKEFSPKHKPSSKRRVSVNSSQIVDIGDNQVVLASENKTEYASDVMLSSDNCSKNGKSSTDVFSSSLDQQGLSVCRLKETDKTPGSLVSPLTQSYIDCLISGQYNFLGDKKTVTQKSRKQKSFNKKVVPEDFKKQGGLAIAKSHVGVKAKVVRTKKIDRSPIDSKKRLSKTKKEMSEAEFKEFKAEQKRIKYEETQKIHLQTLQKVHDRLVDVLIPKYYNKDLNGKR